MKYIELIRDRDRAIEIQLLNIIPQDQREKYRDVVRAAMLKGAVQWEREYLPVLVGDKTAQRIIERLQTERIA